MKEQKTSDLYAEAELVKWVKKAGEGSKAEQLMWLVRNFTWQKRMGPVRRGNGFVTRNHCSCVTHCRWQFEVWLLFLELDGLPQATNHLQIK